MIINERDEPNDENLKNNPKLIQNTNPKFFENLNDPNMNKHLDTIAFNASKDKIVKKDLG